jgi:hypothetical protein
MVSRLTLGKVCFDSNLPMSVRLSCKFVNRLSMRSDQMRHFAVASGMRIHCPFFTDLPCKMHAYILPSRTIRKVKFSMLQRNQKNWELCVMHTLGKRLQQQQLPSLPDQSQQLLMRHTLLPRLHTTLLPCRLHTPLWLLHSQSLPPGLTVL